jgi:hypothetical protein
MRHLFAALALLVAAGLAPGYGAAIGGGHGAMRAGSAVVLASEQPLGQVLKSIDRQIPGRARDARTVKRDGRTVNNVKWQGRDGKVRVITVDATSGRIEQIR